jgi:hypothetical protein
MGKLMLKKRELESVVRNKCVISTLDHSTSKVMHHRLCLCMQIAQHFIRTPPANETDGVVVDVSAKKRHGTPGPEGPGANVGGGDAQCVAKVLKRKAESLCDVVAGDRFRRAIG